MAEEKKTIKKVAKKVVVKKVAPKKVAAKKAADVAVAEKVVVAKKGAVKKSDTSKAAERYIYAVGRRKTASVQARLYIDSSVQKTVVNERELKAYFGTTSLVANIMAPIVAAGLESRATVSLHAQGGGLHGQSDASKLAIARALVKYDPLLRPILKAAGFLTRDARKVERKKPGLKKARKSPQWAKR